MNEPAARIVVWMPLLFALMANPAFPRSWTPLLAGDQFEGWSFDVLDGSPPESIYRMEDGRLIVRGKGNSRAVVQTERVYREFELKFQWRWPRDPGNSGCLIYCSSPRFRNVWPKSLEVQLQHGNAGDFIHIGETIDVPTAQIPKNLPPGSWKHRLRVNLTDDSEKRPGQWNQAHIIARNGSVQVYINGDLVNSGKGLSTSSGKIAFQAEGADIEFREIYVLETH